MADIKLKDTVKTTQGQVGLVVGIGTELGLDYISVRFSPNGFSMQLHKDSLTVLPIIEGGELVTYSDGTTEYW